MSESFDLVITGGTVVSTDGETKTDVGVRDGRIAAVGDLRASKGAEHLDATGLHVLPGVIDTQVHFREPGNEHKEDLATGTAAAALGGVTGIFEMPNTAPPTTTREAFADKMARAAGRARVDYAFFIGAAPGNIDDLATLEQLPGCSGIKLFMGSSTGNLLMADDDNIGRALANGHRRMAVHAEDEPRLKEREALLSADSPAEMHPVWRDAESARLATERLLRLARRYNRLVHVLHVSTGDEMVMLRKARDIATVETTPQHLTLFAPDCYRRLGNYARMNPPIRDESHRTALWEAIADGTVDVIGSDHAPHTREEKDRPYIESPSGMPGVQTLVPIMLDHVNAGRLSLQRFVDLTSAGPARIYRIANKGRIAEGFDADFTLVDLKAARRIEDSWIASRCGWTPFAGVTVTGWPKATILRGTPIMRDDELFGEPSGEPIQFSS